MIAPYSLKSGYKIMTAGTGHLIVARKADTEYRTCTTTEQRGCQI